MKNNNPYIFSVFLAVLVGMATYTIFSGFELATEYVENYGANVLEVFPETREDIDVDQPLVMEMKNPYTDLSEDHPNRDALVYLYYEGILDPTKAEVRADDNVTRAEFAKIIMEAGEFDYSDYASVENCFDDVSTLKEHWFAPYVCAGAAEGFFSGNEGLFNPNMQINRAEALKVVLKAFAYNVPENIAETTFKDVRLDHWYAPVAETAKMNGLIKNDLYFEAGEFITRGELAQMIFNASYSTF